jgi:hypothetical protein
VEIEADTEAQRNQPIDRPVELLEPLVHMIAAVEQRHQVLGIDRQPDVREAA